MALKKIAGEDPIPTKMGGDLVLSDEVSRQNDEVKAAIEAGDLIPQIKLVKRTVEGKGYSKDYLQLFPTNLKGCMVLSGGIETTFLRNDEGEPDFDGACLVKDFFYGNDLGVKNRESQRLAVLVEGPDKAKAAAAKNLAKAFNITEAEAMAKIEAME